MTYYTRRISVWFSFSLCCLILALLLAACGFGGGGTSSAPTPTPTTASAALTTYTGDGYTVSYPQSWKVTKKSTGVTFNDPNGIAYFAISTAPDPNALISADSEVNLALQGFQSQSKNYQKLNVPSTTTVAGDTWSQGAATGDVTSSGKTNNVKIYTIVDNHPASSADTKSFIIAYATGTQVFDLANTAYFQPMLQSFKFA